eukprot:CAMPEP_0176432802 /NCGR_PEP_ID=MMETSP0127-20121128/15605_1 /TAXON_ID=938130 /ORGANISM="Platyophrya macrostoma, Strain WH" /LENGTH=350 /DNA_ID=CAMNT_0017815031 /DNA_START=63 /DNA_END=1115 /DNA_ORIENTATION=-
MNGGQQKAQDSQKEQTQHKDSNHHFQVKKDNAYVPKNSTTSEEKQKSNQDFQPQWKMGGPKRGGQEDSRGYGEYADAYYMGDYTKGMTSAMGMMVYPYSYMGWSPEMYQASPNYYKGGSKPYSKKKKNNFGYEQSAKQSKPKYVFVPISDKNNEGAEQGAGNKAGEESKVNATSTTQTVNASEYTNLEKAKFFIIKSYSEEDVYKSINNNLWCSTPSGNEKLNSAFVAANGEYPIILLFSINGSGHFLGVCQMKSTVDFNRNFEGWDQNHKWRGSFEISWIFIKDIPNKEFRHLKNDLNEEKPVTNSRDTQEVPNDIGMTMLDIFEKYENQTSILDYADYFEGMQKESKQ